MQPVTVLASPLKFSFPSSPNPQEFFLHPASLQAPSSPLTRVRTPASSHPTSGSRCRKAATATLFAGLFMSSMQVALVLPMFPFAVWCTSLSNALCYFLTPPWDGAQTCSLQIRRQRRTGSVNFPIVVVSRAERTPRRTSDTSACGGGA